MSRHQDGADHVQASPSDIFANLGPRLHGFLNRLAIVILHQLHSVGYSDELAGLACTIVIIVGALGTVLFGVLAQVQWRPHQLRDLQFCFYFQKTGKIVEITKLCCLGAIVCVLILSYLLLMPDVGIYILIASAFLGLFALGVFPLALELTVEATFPCDQVIQTKNNPLPPWLGLTSVCKQYNNSIVGK